MLSTLNIKYPEKYKDEESRKGKKFKFYKIEPVEMEKKEKKKEVKIGKGSGRLSTIKNWRENPQQGNINYLKEEILFTETFSELIDNYLEEKNESSSI